MAIMCRRQVALSLLFFALCGAFIECQAETRCDAICNYDNLREQCDRCRLRIPMRFGKRSSPPEEELRDSKYFLHQLKDADDLSSQFLQYLSQTLQRSSSEENVGRESIQEEDVSQPKRSSIVRFVKMIRKKRTLPTPDNSEGWLRRAVIARQRHLLAKHINVHDLSPELVLH